jgi:phosphatidylserine/phosphatidylglycerophosphate/cardiolipin synthase-like enzyme
VYLPTDEIKAFDYDRFLKLHQHDVSFSNPIGHCQVLAGIARQISSKDHRWRTLLHSLLQALAESQQFVHFVSFGISWQFVGVLKLAAQKKTVRGVISNADRESVSELVEFRDDAPRLHVHAFGQDKQLQDVPHHKLIIVDGLLAFKGSANLTLPGWRKAEKGLEIIEVVTDIAEVTRLHNEYFSPLWGKTRQVADPVVMTDDIPF